MSLEQVERPLLGARGGIGDVRRVAVAREAVSGVGIPMHRHMGVRFENALHRRDGCGRNPRIALPEMQKRRYRQTRELLEVLLEFYRVVAQKSTTN